MKTQSSNTYKDDSCNQELFTELYHQSIQKSYAYAFYLTHSEDAARDLLQEAYIKAFTHMKDLDDTENFQRWFKKIIVHQFYDQVRKQGKEPLQSIEGEDFSNSYLEDRIDYNPSNQINQQAVSEIIRKIINQLPDEQRIAILMFYYDQYSVKEIAELLECSENTVKSRLNYARKKLKADVQEIEEKDGYKLYNVSIIPFFVWLLSETEKTDACRIAMQQQILGNVINNVPVLQPASVKTKKVTTTVSSASSMVKGEILLAILCIAAGGGFLYMQTRGNDTSKAPAAVIEKEQVTKQEQSTEKHQTSVFDESKPAREYFTEALKKLDEQDSFHVTQAAKDYDKNPLTMEMDYIIAEQEYYIAPTQGGYGVYQGDQFAIIYNEQFPPQIEPFMYTPLYSKMYAANGVILSAIKNEQCRILSNGNLEVTLVLDGSTLVNEFFKLFPLGTDFVPLYEENTVVMEINQDMLPVSLIEDNDYGMGIGYYNYTNARSITFSNYNKIETLHFPQEVLDAMP